MFSDRREDSGSEIGSKIVKVVPIPGSDSQEIVPWCASIIFLVIHNPSPVPSSFVVNNGVKMLERTSAGMPQPLSDRIMRM